jgi:hypothetical protein
VATLPFEIPLSVLNVPWMIVLSPVPTTDVSARETVTFSL